MIPSSAVTTELDKSLLVVVTTQDGKIVTGPDEILEAVAMGKAFHGRAEAQALAARRSADQREDNRSLRGGAVTEETWRAMVTDGPDASDVIGGGSGFQYNYVFEVMSIAAYETRILAEARLVAEKELTGLLLQIGVRFPRFTDLAALKREADAHRHPMPASQFVRSGSLSLVDRNRRMADYDLLGHPAYRAACALIDRMVKEEADQSCIFAPLM